jgi:hypothetical protein
MVTAASVLPVDLFPDVRRAPGERDPRAPSATAERVVVAGGASIVLGRDAHDEVLHVQGNR